MATQTRPQEGTTRDRRPGVRRPPPVWRLAPLRLLRDRVALALTVAALALVGASAAAGPLYAESVSDSSLRLVLDGIPSGASANADALVRVSGGVDPDRTLQERVLDAVDDAPGLAPPTVMLRSVSTELQPRIYFDPVAPTLTHDGRTTTVRLFGTDDPAAALVPVGDGKGRSGGVWVPEPVADAAGIAPGDEVELGMRGVADAPTATATVAGVYAVEADGRTPREAPGRRLWADLRADGFPYDPERTTLRAHLVVADPATTEALARRLEDRLLWTARAELDPPLPRLAELSRTADAVADLRRDLAGLAAVGGGPLDLRPAVASGIEDVAARADALATAARRGAAFTTAAGVLLALVLVAAAAGVTTARRREEVRLAAGTGRRPVSAAALLVLEGLPAAVLAAPAGWLLARVLVGASVTGFAPSRPALTSSAVAAGAGVLVGLVVSGLVVAAAVRRETRRLAGHAPARVPWVVVLVVLAGAAVGGLLTRPPVAGDRLGPLDVLVPPLLAAAVAALGVRLVGVLLRRLPAARRPPTRRRVVGWLAGRRLRAPDGARDVTTTVAATGLAMLVLSLSALHSVEQTVRTRAAVTAGAVVVHDVEASWRLDPDVARQAVPPDDGTPLEPEDVPVARTPPLPAGQTVVWRTRSQVVTTTSSAEVLVVDPRQLAAAAAWGAPGGPLDDARAVLPGLAAADATAVATLREHGSVPAVPAVLVGHVTDLDLGPGDLLSVDTLGLPVPLEVRATLDVFPGAGEDTLVVPADSWFSVQGNADPRLRPAPGTPRNRPVEYGTQLWADDAAAAATTLADHGLQQSLVRTLARAEAEPEYVAAVQARRYQVALGVVFGLLGGGAVVLSAVRLARRSPAADRMLAWVGTGRHAPGRARFVEVGVVLLLSALLAAAVLLVLRLVAPLLLDPGGGRPPPVDLVVPAPALLAGAVWLAATTLVTGVATAVAARTRSTAEVLRGDG